MSHDPRSGGFSPLIPGPDPDLAEVVDGLERLEDRARRVFRRPPPTPRAEKLAAIMNFLIFGRWPGEAPYRPDPPE